MARIMKQDALRLLGNVPEEYVFRCCDGRIFRTLQETREILESMTDETFAFHSNVERNDFSKWVKDIIKDEKLARDLGKSKNCLL